MIIFTEASALHAENEDAVRAEKLGTGWFCAIADGQGGRDGGAPASRIACEQSVRHGLQRPASDWLLPASWQRLFQSVDQAVMEDSKAGFTTLITLTIHPGRLMGASCGDSAAYLLNGNTELLILTAQQRKNPQIGSGMSSCTCFDTPLKSPWTLLLMTDGVWKYVGIDRIEDMMRTHRGEAFSTEVQKAGRSTITGKFPDDFTFLMLEG